MQSIADGSGKPFFLQPGGLLNIKQEPRTPGTAGKPFLEPPSNISNPDSESGYSSFGGDTPSSGKSHSPVTSGSATVPGSLALLQQQKDIKPDITQLNMLTMMNGHGGGGGAGGMMSNFLHSMSNMNGDLNHHAHPHPHAHMNGLNMNGHGPGGNHGHSSGGPHSNTMLHSNGHSNSGNNGATPGYGRHPSVDDTFMMVNSLGGGNQPTSMSQTTSPHSSGGGQTPVMMSPTSTQMSPQMSSPTPPALVPKQEPIVWNEWPPCMSQIPVPNEDPMIWVKQVQITPILFFLFCWTKVHFVGPLIGPILDLV